MEKFKKVSNIILNEFGYDSFSEFFKSTLFLDIKYIFVYFSGFLASVLLQIFDKLFGPDTELPLFLDANIYNPSQAIYWLFIITMFDIVSGMAKASSTSKINGTSKQRDIIQGNRFFRSIIRFLVQLFFVIFLYNLSLLYPELSLHTITHGVMLGFIFGTFLSGWNNAYQMGWVTKEVHEWIVSILDLRKLIQKFFGTNGKENGKDQN